MEKFYHLLSSPESYPQWLQPVESLTEVMRLSEDLQFQAKSPKDGTGNMVNTIAIVCKGEINILGSVLNGFSYPIVKYVTSYVSQKAKLPFELVIERSQIRSCEDDGLNTAQFVLKFLPSKCTVMKTLLPALKMDINLEAFRGAELLFVDVKAHLSDANFGTNFSNSFILNKLIESLTNLKAYSRIAPFENKKRKVVFGTVWCNL